jgi:hypothetical protein
MTPFVRSRQQDLDRARDRLHYCRKQRVAYEVDSERSQLTLRKLREDEKRAQINLGWAEHKLSECLVSDEVTTAFKANVQGLDL